MVFKNTYSDQVFRMATSYISKFFSNGWGSPEVIRRLAEMRTVVSDPKRMLQDVYKILEKTEIKLSPGKKVNSSMTLYNGEFISPLTKLIPKALPPESEKAHFQLLLPNEWRDKKPICIHLAGTGDHFFWRRRHFMATPLAKEHHIGSIILENPFYGQRKPKDQVRSSVNHVTDIFVMGAALLFETVTLMLWCQKNNLGPLGVTGVSMGGHMATVAATGWFDPIAIVPCLSWSSAGPAFTEGVLSNSVNWSVLEKQLEDNPEYRRVVRNDSEFLESLQLHYTDSINILQQNKNQQPIIQAQNIQNVDEHISNNNDENKSKTPPSTIYSKFSSAISDIQLSSFIDLKGKKIGHIALEMDLWKYIDTIPKQIYHSTYARLNLDYLRELSIANNSDIKHPSKETKDYMTAIMDQATHLSHYRKPNKDSPIIYVVAEYDRYIPRESYAITPQDIWPGTEVRTLDTGHVIACLNRQSDFRKAIKDAYGKLGCNFEN